MAASQDDDQALSTDEVADIIEVANMAGGIAAKAARTGGFPQPAIAAAAGSAIGTITAQMIGTKLKE